MNLAATVMHTQNSIFPQNKINSVLPMLISVEIWVAVGQKLSEAYLESAEYSFIKVARSSPFKRKTIISSEAARFYHSKEKQIHCII